MAHEAEAAREPLAGFRGEVLATWAEWTRLQLRLGSPFAHKVRELLVLRTRLRRPRRRLRHNCCDTPQRQDERSEEHTSELQSRLHLVCRLLLEKKKRQT